MQFKPAAGLFVGGVTMSICGPILSSACAYFATVALARANETMANVFFIVAAFGALLTLIGFCVLIAATHRALVKIDALRVQQHDYREDWSVQQH